MKKLLPLLLLGAAFGIVEGSVVIFLRPIFNSGSEAFAIEILQRESFNAVQNIVLMTEIGREVATIVFLVAAAAVGARSFLYWCGYFVFTFGVWDITYYIWLNIRIDWPASLLDWDILFLIPKMWLAPVIVPIVISIIGILMSVLLVRTLDVCGRISLRFYHWTPILLALLLWQISFLNQSVEGNQFPESYSWSLFIIGIILCIGASVVFFKDFLNRRRNLMFRT